MIHWSSILRLLGFLALFLAGALTVPLLYAIIEGDAGLLPLSQALAVTAGAAAILLFRFPGSSHELTHREGILLVVASWLMAGLIGALPYQLSGYFPTFTDALFESISGFTTTGASVVQDVEALPGSLLFWRAVTHWLGGMGIIVLMVAILPLIGMGGMELYRAEFSGARSEKLKPRIAETAVSLWKIYVALTLAEYVALRLAGMGRLDSVCHSFATVATGGFSTRNLSVEAFASPTIELIIVFFMVAAGFNFTQHYRLLVQWEPRAVVRDLEIRSYLFLLGLATLVMTVAVFASSSLSWVQAARYALFQTVSIGTCTGLSTTDFARWSPFAQLLLLALMFAGGCTASTAGGLKTARMVLLMRVVSREFRRMVERRAVFAIRFNERAVSERAIQSLLNLVYIAFLVNFGACLLLAASGVDIVTTISAVAAAMFGVGPGLNKVGPYSNYGGLPILAKWVLSFCMLAGRLEFYTLLVLFTPSFWRN